MRLQAIVRILTGDGASVEWVHDTTSKAVVFGIDVMELAGRLQFREDNDRSALDFPVLAS